jgi:hypothetical protein
MSAILIFSLGCATTRPIAPTEQVDIPEVKIIQRGWFPMDKDGYSWVLQDSKGTMIGRCYYTYMRISGSEQWAGVFYQKTTDFSFKPFYEARTDGLAECVGWIESLAMGGYYN